jgi:UDP:flavonoid glycosyltransferase YjiC (YdhE family)
MRVLFTSMRVPSHFLPLVPFIAACRQRGHEVAVTAPAELEQRAVSTGAAFFALGHPGDARLEPIWARMRDASPEESKRIGIGELFAGALAGAALPSLVETVQRWRPDIVVRESQEYAAVLAAEKAGLPCAHVSITARRPELDTFALAEDALDAHRKELGLPAALTARLQTEPALTLFPQALEDPAFEPGPARRYRAASQPAPPLPDWWRGARAPFVYATLGTVAGGMQQMRSAYAVVLEAVRRLPLRVLLTVGADLPLELLGEVPPHVHVERFVPQHEVLPHAGAVLCHGGSGSVIGALSAGVPLLVLPMFADQTANAARVGELGAGIALPKRCAEPEAVERALTAVLGGESFRAAAGRVAAEIAALPPVEDAALELESLARAAPSRSE